MRARRGAAAVIAGLLAVAGFTLHRHAGGLLAAIGLDVAAPVENVVALAGGVLGWLGLAYLGVALTDAAVARATAGSLRGPPPRLIQDLARVVLFAAAVVAILAYVFDLPVGGLLATSGVLVAVIGFALRNMIADVFSGIALNVEHPYRIGDWVEVAPGVTGRVAEINWRATRLVTRDQVSVVVPNGLIAGSRFLNYSYPERHYRANLRLALDAAIPVERAKRILLAAALGAPRVLAEPRPQVQVEGLDERGACYVVRYWVADYADDNPCRDAVMSNIARALQQAGIGPAFPHREVALTRPAERRARLGLADMLRRVALFRDFDESDVEVLAAMARERPFREGERIVAQGEAGDSLFLLAEGALDVRVAAAEGALPATIDRMLPGEVFGEVSLLTGQPRSASICAATDGIVFEIRKEHLEPILRRRPRLAEELAALMSRRQNANRERMEAASTAPGAPPAAPEHHDLLERLRGFFGLS